jgi:hypothetical protein
MLRYARDPVLRAMHGRAGRERVVRNFDGAKQTRKIQEEIVQASGVGPQGRPEESSSTLD